MTDAEIAQSADFIRETAQYAQVHIITLRNDRERLKRLRQKGDSHL